MPVAELAGQTHQVAMLALAQRRLIDQWNLFRFQCGNNGLHLREAGLAKKHKKADPQQNRPFAASWHPDGCWRTWENDVRASTAVAGDQFRWTDRDLGTCRFVAQLAPSRLCRIRPNFLLGRVWANLDHSSVLGSAHPPGL